MKPCTWIPKCIPKCPSSWLPWWIPKPSASEPSYTAAKCFGTATNCSDFSPKQPSAVPCPVSTEERPLSARGRLCTDRENVELLSLRVYLMTKKESYWQELFQWVLRTCCRGVSSHHASPILAASLGSLCASGVNARKYQQHDHLYNLLKHLPHSQLPPKWCASSCKGGRPSSSPSRSQVLARVVHPSGTPN